MNQALEDLGDYIAGLIADDLEEHRLINDELVLVTRPESLHKVIRFLRDDSQCLFKLLVDVCGVDYPERERRFEVVYNLLSISHNQRIRVKVSVAEDEPVPSVAQLYPTANWFEREVWDLYGVFFSEHPDLRRLMMPEDWEGHPLRKDYPLGYEEVQFTFNADEIDARKPYVKE